MKLPFDGRMPRLGAIDQFKAYREASSLRQRVDIIGQLTREAGQLDGVALSNQGGRVVLSGADLRQCPSFKKLPAGLFPLPEKSFSSVTGSAQLDPRTGRVASLDIELGNDRFGQCHYSVETSNGPLGLGKTHQLLQEELPSLTGSYALGQQSTLEIQPGEWNFSRTKLTGMGPKTIF